MFRVRGDVVEIYPVYQESALRIEFWGDVVESLSTIDPLLGEVIETHERLPIYPKSHFVMPQDRLKRAIGTIKEELDWWEPQLIDQGNYWKPSGCINARCMTSRCSRSLAIVTGLRITHAT